MKGLGILEWNFIDDDGTLCSICSIGYYIPGCPMRLCSPQSVFMMSEGGELCIKHDNCLFQWKDGAKMSICYDATSNLPIATGYSRGSLGSVGQQINLCVTDMLNQNLTPAQKELLCMHYRWGHIGFAWLQWLAHKAFCGLPGQIGKCTPPLCVACQMGKTQCIPTGKPPQISLKQVGNTHAIAAGDLKLVNLLVLINLNQEYKVVSGHHWGK